MIIILVNKKPDNKDIDQELERLVSRLNSLSETCIPITKSLVECQQKLEKCEEKDIINQLSLQKKVIDYIGEVAQPGSSSEWYQAVGGSNPPLSTKPTPKNNKEKDNGERSNDVGM